MILFHVLNVVLSFVVITVLFGVIFKVLPDVKNDWKDALGGDIYFASIYVRSLGHRHIRKQIRQYIYVWRGGLTIAILLWVYYTAAK